MDLQKLLDMKIGEETKIPGGYYVLRVPGGWMYTYMEERGEEHVAISSCFVPEPPGAFVFKALSGL